MFSRLRLAVLVGIILGSASGSLAQQKEPVAVETPPLLVTDVPQSQSQEPTKPEANPPDSAQEQKAQPQANTADAAKEEPSEKDKQEGTKKTKRPWNQFFDDKAFSMRLDMVLLFDFSSYSQDGNSKAQIGKLSDAYHLRAGRIILAGEFKFHHPWTYIAGVNYNGIDRPASQKNFAFTDLALGIPLGKFGTVSVGKQREGASQIMQMVGTGSPLMERATIMTALLPTRNVGVVFFNNALKQRMTWSAGWFNSWLESGVFHSFGTNGNQFVGRVNGLPFYKDDGAKLLELGIAYRYSDAQDGKFSFRSKGEDNNGPNFVATGSFPAEYSNLIGLQGATVTGPFSLQAEYLHTDVEAPTVGNPRFQGYYAMASYFLTGEHRAYNTKGGFFLKTRIVKKVVRSAGPLKGHRHGFRFQACS